MKFSPVLCTTGPGLDAVLLHPILPYLLALPGGEGYLGAPPVSQVSSNLQFQHFLCPVCVNPLCQLFSRPLIIFLIIHCYSLS